MNKIKHFIGSIKIEDLVMLLVFLLSIIFIVIKASLSSAAGRAPYESWAYSVKIKVTNPGQPRTDYCVRLEIPTTPYIDSGRMNSDLRDIRFSQSGIALPFWIHITESMNRNSYSIPIYVKIKTLNTGDNYIYMHFDKNRQATDSPPSGGTSYLCANPGTGVNFTSASCAHSCVGSPVTTFPFSGKNAGASAFSIFAYDSRDTDTWNRTGSFRATGEKWISKTRLSNSFIFHFRTHLYLPNEAMPYFLLQGTTPPLPANIDSTNGYRLYIDYDATVSDNYHYNRGRYYLKLFRRTAAGETQVAISQPLYIYNNTIWDWDILVSTSTVKVVTNGIEVLSYTRSGETFNGGYVGFKRLPIAGGECAGNSTDGISPIWAIDKYNEQDIFSEVMGNPDLAVKRIKPGLEADFKGFDIIEYPPRTQIREGYVYGDTFDKYIYRAYKMAGANQQFEYSIKIRNRGDNQDTFNLIVKPSTTIGWSFAYKYDGGFHENLPGIGSNTLGSITIQSGGEWEIGIVIIPGEKVLFGGGKLDLLFTVEGGMDMCVDTARFISCVRPKLECSWKHKMPITISYKDTYNTGDLRDYQVLVNIPSNKLSGARTDGTDIIFTEQGGGFIPFWMKKFTGSGNSSSWWVNVPKINSSPPTQGRESSEAFDYAVFSKKEQVYKGGGSCPNNCTVNNGSVHSDEKATINNCSHDIVCPDYENDSPIIGCESLPNPNYKGDIPFPLLDLAYYRALAISQGRHYTTCSGVLLPTGGGVTMVEVTSECIVSFTGGLTGNGTLIIIGANLKIGGNVNFTGLIYVKKATNGNGGNITLNGNPTITGQVIVEGAVTASNGTPCIYYEKQNAILDPNQPELPPTPGTIATTRIYCWWGNPDYIISRSNKKETFDLWEDWEDRDLDTVAGCPDNTSDCSGKPADLTGWRNLPTPANNYNWWRIRNRLDGKAIMADKGGSFGSDDIGPFVVGGDIRWSNYEVIYTFYDEYCNYSDCGQVWGNPQYNPVCHYDPGNTWGMEYFANMFIFRPYGDGTDWTWQYQSYPKDILGESFPAKNKRYWIKVRPFYRPDNGNTHLSLLVAKATPTDEDLDTGYKHITENEAANPPGFIAPLAYASQGGAIGFGGWNGGFSYDNIRVRKFVYPEPTVEIGSPQTLAYRPIKTLSFPNITQPLMDRRRCLVIGSIEPWIWRGNLYAYYADCYLSGDCKEGESTSTLGSISLWGSETSGKEKGFGDHLKEAIVGTNNLSYDSIKNEPLDWKKRERHIFTAGTTTPPPLAVNGGFINFDYNNREQLKPFLNVPGEELIDLINFVRGRYVQRYSRSKLRMTDGSTADNCQWKLGDIVHSNPLIVGLPTMYYPDTDYESFRKQNGSRTLVAYFGSNEGMIHCVRMAKYEKDNLTGKSKYKSDFTARELWTFIPQGLLGKLKETTDTEHEYTADGLLRAIDIWDNIEGKYKTVLVGVLRTGGSSIFAIDITDPYQPKLLWEKNKDSAGYETFFQNIGETFSSPALGMLDKGLGPKNNPWVGIFGSGLDPIDVNNIFTKKAYLTIINLKDGSIIENKQFKVSDKIGNITSNIECIIDKFGKIIRISFGDYFGGLFRVDLSTSSKVATFLSKVSLSDYLFFEPSDYSTSNMWTGTPPKWPVPTEPVFGTIKSKEEKFYIYLPTGDYDSYDSNYPHQRVYCLDETTIPSPYSYYKGTSTLIDMTNSSNTNPDEKSYFIELGHSDIKDYATTGAISSKDRNERCLSPVEVFGGVLFFTTFTPSPSACEGGNTRFYATHFASGKYYDNLIKQVPGKEDVRSVSYLNVGVPSSPMTYLGRGSEGEKLAAGIMNTGSADILQVSLNPSIFPAVNILLWRELR